MGEVSSRGRQYLFFTAPHCGLRAGRMWRDQAQTANIQDPCLNPSGGLEKLFLLFEPRCLRICQVEVIGSHSTGEWGIWSVQAPGPGSQALTLVPWSCFQIADLEGSLSGLLACSSSSAPSSDLPPLALEAPASLSTSVP